MTRHRSNRHVRGLFRRVMPSRQPEMFFRRRSWMAACVAILLIGLVVVDHLRQPAPTSQFASVGDYARYHDQTFRVTRVVDGDTLHIDAPDGRKITTAIRLWGVDTPEVHGVDTPMYFGEAASAFAHAAADGQFVRLELLEGNTRDRHGRLLAYVYLPSGSMLNECLIEQGFAYADTRFSHPHKATFSRLETVARQRRIGLWKDVTPDKMPRWRQQREKSISWRPAGRMGTLGQGASACTTAIGCSGFRWPDLPGQVKMAAQTVIPCLDCVLRAGTFTRQSRYGSSVQVSRREGCSVCSEC